jgi:membrane protease subunit (stomatin/prohibitin family)
VFVDQGKLADVFTPGRYELTTANVPILATLKGWKYGFSSPFKCEVYFVTTRQFTDLKWGTMNPVMLRDAEFGPIRLRAFGTYAMKCVEPGKLVQEISGATGAFTADGIADQIRNMIVSRFAEVLGESKIPALDLAANYSELGGFVLGHIRPDLARLGLDLTQLLVENVSLPPEVEQALDKRTSMGVIGNLNAYTQFQAAEALRDAAKNPGAAGQMMGVVLGQGLAGSVAGNMQQSASAGTPPPLPQAAGYFVAINGQQAGPFGVAELAARASRGEITRETLVWKQGMSGWVAAGQVAEMASVFVTPPPMPG